MSDLLKYIESLNAKADLLMEQEPGLWMSKYTDDMSYWYDMGIYTVEDFRRNELINGISDASKDLYGCRLRLDWNEMTMEQMEATYDNICAQLNAQYEEERDAAEFEKTCKGLSTECEPLPYEEYADLEVVA